MTVPRARPGGVALQLLEVGDQQDRLEQRVEVRPCLRRHVDELVRRRPTRTGTMPCSTICVRTRCGSASSLSTLLTATTIGTPAAFAWSSASIVCGITPSSAATTSTAMSVTCGAARAHRRERLVARRVDERDLAVADVRLVGADVLRDAAELAGDHVGLADRVEQLRLAVVDVAHDGDDRRRAAPAAASSTASSSSTSASSSTPTISAAWPSSVGDQLDRLVGQRRAWPSPSRPAVNRIFTMSAGDRPELLGDRLRRGAPDEPQHRQRGAGDRPWARAAARDGRRAGAADSPDAADRRGVAAAAGGAPRLRLRPPRRPSAAASALRLRAGRRLEDLSAASACRGSPCRRRRAGAAPPPRARSTRRYRPVAHLLEGAEDLLARDPQLLRQFVNPHALPSCLLDLAP